jgi:hypothetical protein
MEANGERNEDAPWRLKVKNKRRRTMEAEGEKRKAEAQERLLEKGRGGSMDAELEKGRRRFDRGWRKRMAEMEEGWYWTQAGDRRC